MLVTATSAQYRYYQDDSKEGVVVKFNSVSPGSQLAQVNLPFPFAWLVLTLCCLDRIRLDAAIARALCSRWPPAKLCW